MTRHDDSIDMLRDAAKAVEEANLAPELRAVGFWALLQPLHGSPVSGGGMTPNAATAEAVSGDALERLASKIELSREAVEAVYYVDEDGRPALGLAAARLGRRTAEAARRVALLVALARQFDGHEQFTSSGAIRTVCQDFGVFDTGNFAKTLLAMTDVFQFQGTGPNRKVRLVRPGYEEARRLVQDLAS